MMELQVIATGSSGNAYVLRSEGAHSLLLDAGVPVKRLLTEIRDWRNLEGCLVTHEHMDHAKSALDVAGLGVPVYATRGTIEALGAGCDLRGMVGVLMGQLIEVGGFIVLPFGTEHDAAEPCGWLIRAKGTGETVLYATDTYYLRNTFPGVHYWIIECNYDESVLAEQLGAGEIAEPLRDRLMRSHMSLRRTCDTLKANDLTETRAIVLVHLSDERSDEKMMVETVKAMAGIDDVWAAEAGKTYRLELIPF